MEQVVDRGGREKISGGHEVDQVVDRGEREKISGGQKVLIYAFL